MGSKNTGFVIKSRVWLFDFLLLFLIWLALTWTLDPFTVVVGISPRRLFWLLVYIPYFFYYLLKANFDVLYRVLHPDLPINPGIVKILTGLSSDMGKSFLANSITLTPGTLTVDIDGEYLYVHWINVTTQDIEEASKIISGRFEKIIRRIFE